MIIDISELTNHQTLEADVCVVGAGAAGITVAHEFISRKLSVILLEGGGTELEQPSQDPYRSEVVGLPHAGIHRGRVRVVGGTTTLWAGQILPLTPIDFATREWVEHSGWPITREGLDPYYRRAERVMGLEECSYDRRSWPTSTIPEYNPDVVTPYYSQFATEPDLAVKYLDQLRAASGVTVVTHANVVALNASESASRVEEVVVRSLDGRQIRVRARQFVICCGGIDTARLLLASDSVQKGGLGNTYDVVGRYFQDHPGAALTVKSPAMVNVRALHDSVRRGGRRCGLRWAASETFQRTNRTLNVAAELYYPVEDDGAIAAAKAVFRSIGRRGSSAELRKSIAQAVRDLPAVSRAAFAYYILRKPASVGSSAPLLGVGVEQEPCPNSRITLSDERDAVGMRRTVLDWRVSKLTVTSLELFARALDAEWRRLGLGTIDVDGAQLEKRARGESGGLTDSFHHIGTTRMGSDPKSSVVDPDCRVHGLDNLYIGSSSVFPTSGFSNPTLTIIALCLRIADTINNRCRTV